MPDGYPLPPSGCLKWKYFGWPRRTLRAVAIFILGHSGGNPSGRTRRVSSGIVVRRAALLSRPFLPLEQVGQVHLENLLRPLEAFEKVGPERLSMSGNKH